MIRTMTKTSSAVLQAYLKGYRVIEGKVYYKNNQVKDKLKKNGYHGFAIRLEGGERYLVSTHRLVAFQKFGSRIFEDGIQVRHLDSNSSNNLEWNIGIGTPSENSRDKTEDVRMRCGKYAASFKIKYDAEVIKKRRAEGASYKQLMEEFGISSKGTLSHIINKR